MRLQKGELLYNLEELIDLLEQGEDKLLDQLFYYATKFNYVKYTSTLKEAWRISINGLTTPLIKSLETKSAIPEFGPDEDFEQDPIASFGILEAQKHRDRGVTLGMFLGLMKYYRQAYLDLVNEAKFERTNEDYYLLYINRFFDRVELGFCTEWLSNPQQKMIKDLQITNRSMTNEKNKYLTFYESLPNPSFFINLKNKIENFNHSAAQFFGHSTIPGAQYYGDNEPERVPVWMETKLLEFISSEKDESYFEKSIQTTEGNKHFNIKMKKMLDISTKFSGVIVILNDLTSRKIAEEKLKNSEINYRNAYDRANFYQDVFVHDMNNILHNINLSTSLLSISQQNSENKIDNDETLEILREQVKRGASLISTVYKLSKIEEMDESLKPIEVYQILKKSIEFIKNSFNQKQILVDINIPDKKVNIIANDLLVDLFENILTNAVKFTNNSIAKISIKFSDSIRDDIHYLKIEFIDNGMGINDEMKEFVFHRGYRKEKNIRGMGLGLSLVKKIIDSYDGQIWVEDNVKGDFNKGSNFVLLLRKA